MKLFVLIVQDYDAPEVLRAMLDAGFGVTQVSTTGGFLREGNTTFLVGAEDADGAKLLRIVEHNCSERIEVVRPTGATDFEEWYPADQIEVEVGGATVFVFNVSRYERV